MNRLIRDDVRPPRANPANPANPANLSSLAILAVLALGLTGCVPGLPDLPPPPAETDDHPPAAAPVTSPHADADAEPARHRGTGNGSPYPAAWADDAPDCFQQHLREAITLNTRRAGTYSAWSDGASEPISRGLIRSERLALVPAWHVDRRARSFQEAGVPIGCAEFISMAMTPPLEAEPTPPGRPFTPGPAPDSILDTIRAAYGSGGFPGVEAAAELALKPLENAPEFNCMTRHLLESIRRLAGLAPLHAAAARDAGLDSPRPLSELLLRLHLAAVPDAADLDRRAAPLQQRGIPILCRDVPPIPPVPSDPSDPTLDDGAPTA